MRAHATKMRIGGRNAPAALAVLIAAMFAPSVQGAWYDPSDMSTMYQDAVGLSPVVALEQPVGLIRDCAQHRALTKNVAPSLDDANWAGTSGAPSLVFNGTYVDVPTAATGGRSALGKLGIGKLYRAEFEIYESVTGTMNMPYDGSGSNVKAVSRTGVHSHTFFAGTTSLFLYSTNFIGKIRNVRVFEIPFTELVTNGTFNTDLSGWTTPNTGGASVVQSAGTALLTSGAATGDVARLRQSFTVVSGLWYEMYFEVSNLTGTPTTNQISMGTTAGGAEYFAQAITANGSQRRTFQATATSMNISFYLGNTNVGAVSFNMDRFSLRVLPGQVATQATTTSRPVLSARFNQILQTEVITNANWVKGNGGVGSATVVTDNFGVAPDGTTTASRVQFALNGGTTTSDYSALQQTVAVQNGSVYSSGVWLKTNDGTSKVLIMRDDLGSPSITSNITVTGTWQFFSHLNKTMSNTSSATVKLWLRGSLGTADSADILFWHPQFEIGPTLGNYQRVGIATDYNAVGFPMYLRFDGVDDSLITASVDFSASDKLTFSAGLQTASTSGTQIIVEQGTNYVNAIGGFEVSLNEVVAGACTFARRSNVPNNVYRSELVQVAPRRSVVSAQSDFSVGQGIVVRTSGQATSSAVSNTGTNAGYANTVLNIGRRNNASNPFVGNLYGLVIMGAYRNPDQLRTIERYLGEKSGVAL